jgi:hypothetical protein
MVCVKCLKVIRGQQVGGRSQRLSFEGGRGGAGVMFDSEKAAPEFWRAHAAPQHD